MCSAAADEDEDEDEEEDEDEDVVAGAVYALASSLRGSGSWE